MLSKKINFVLLVLFSLILIFMMSCDVQKPEGNIKMEISQAVQTSTIQALLEKHGNKHKSRIEIGVNQAAG